MTWIKAHVAGSSYDARLSRGSNANPSIRSAHASGPAPLCRASLGHARTDRADGRRSKLTQAEREQEIPSGGTRLIANRVHWAKTYLKKAGLLEQPKRGTVQISPTGRDLLKSHPTKIDVQLLHGFPEFQGFLNKAKSQERAMGATDAAPIMCPSSTPEEEIDAASGALNEALRDALLARILEASPASFEKLIIDLLLAMGYGGSRADAGEQLGRTGDGGVDGVIREDRLGLDRVYLQAKCYKPGNPVDSPTVQGFVGALVGRGAQKGACSLRHRPSRNTPSKLPSNRERYGSF